MPQTGAYNPDQGKAEAKLTALCGTNITAIGNEVLAVGAYRPAPCLSKPRRARS